MRYFFHLVGEDEFYADDKGWDFTNFEDAKAEAALIARDMATDDDLFVGYVVSVTDDIGNEIAYVPIEHIWDLQ